MHPLALVFVLAASLRAAAGMTKETPAYMPDEYMYAELGRSLAEHGRPLVRGAEAQFPALLQPLVSAPAWLLGDTALSYHLVIALAASAMALAAVPVYVLARRLELSTAVATLVAAFTVAIPDLLYAQWLLAEPFAYPLVVAAVAAGAIALGGGGRRAQAAFVVLTFAAAFARAQFLVLPLCYLLAAGVVGLRARRFREVVNEQGLVLVVLAAPLAAALLLRRGSLGMYGSFTDVQVDATELVARLGANGLGLAYAAALVIVPGAVLGLVAAVRRPRTPLELAFGALSGTVVAALLVQASLYGDLDRIQERYAFYALPLLGLLFALSASRGRRSPVAQLMLGLALAALVVAFPPAQLSESTAKTQSPTLIGVFRLEELLGSTRPVLVIAATLAAAGGLLALVRHRSVGIGALLLATAATAAVAVAAVDFDLRNARGVRSAFFPHERAWVDATGLRDVTLLRGGARRTDTLEQLFWNRSVTRMALVMSAQPADSFAAPTALVRLDGRFTVDGAPVTGNVLVDEWGAGVELRNARAVAGTPSHRLWASNGVPKLSFYAPGFYGDGWLTAQAGLNVWAPTRNGRIVGWVTFTARPPAESGPATLRVEVASTRRIDTIRLAAGRDTPVRIAVCSRGAWHAAVSSAPRVPLDTREVGAQATRPVWTPDPAACKG